LEINSINEDTFTDSINKIDNSKESKANKTKNKSREPKDNLDSNSKPKKNKTNSKNDLAMTFIPTDDNFINSGSKLFNSRTVNLTNSLSQTKDEKIKIDKNKTSKDNELLYIENINNIDESQLSNSKTNTDQNNDVNNSSKNT
jgi:hypothetical protein